MMSPMDRSFGEPRLPSEREPLEGMDGHRPSWPPAGGRPQRPARRWRYDSPVTDWQWWLGPVAIVLALVFAVIASLVVDGIAGALGVHVSSTSNLPGGLIIVDTVLQDAIFVATAVVLARSGLRKVSSAQFGLLKTPRWRAAGLVVLTFGVFLLISLIWAALIETKTTERLLEQLGTNEGTALLIGSAALTCVVAPICEELLFRGFVFTSLRNLRGPWVAAVITGLLFGAVHATSAPVVYLLPLAVLGFLLCVLYRATGSLYACMAAHCLNNSIAFGALEGWGWQIPVLLVASLSAIFAVMVLANRVGLISGGSAGPPALPAGAG